MKDQDLNKYHILTVHVVSVDNYILQDPDDIYHKRGN